MEPGPGGNQGPASGLRPHDHVIDYFLNAFGLARVFERGRQFGLRARPADQIDRAEGIDRDAEINISHVIIRDQI